MKTGIVITSHDGHLNTLKECIESAKMAADYVVCGYHLLEKYPPPELALLCDMFFIVGHHYGCQCRVCTKRVYRTRLGEAAQAKHGIWWISNKVSHVLKIQGDIRLQWEDKKIDRITNELLGDKDLLVMPRDRQSRRWDSGQFSTEVYLGKSKTLNKIFSALKVDRMVMLEIQFSNTIHRLKEKGLLTYRIVNKMDYSLYRFLKIFPDLEVVR